MRALQRHGIVHQPRVRTYDPDAMNLGLMNFNLTLRWDKFVPPDKKIKRTNGDYDGLSACSRHAQVSLHMGTTCLESNF